MKDDVPERIEVRYTESGVKIISPEYFSNCGDMQAFQALFSQAPETVPMPAIGWSYKRVERTANTAVYELTI